MPAPAAGGDRPPRADRPHHRHAGPRAHQPGGRSGCCGAARQGDAAGDDRLAAARGRRGPGRVVGGVSGAGAAGLDAAGALLEALTPGSGLGVAVHDEDLKMLVISPSLAELSGTSAEAQLGRRLTEALPGEVGEVAEASLRTVAATREPLLQLEPAIEAGRERGWLISVYPIDYEDRELIAVVALDVTESRRAQQRLHESRERLATAQHMAGVGSWSWDVVADTWTWSDELFRLAGLAPSG